VGRRSITGGVTAKGQRRIQFEFKFEGARYRPTLQRTPSEGNLRRAREQLARIKERISAGTFAFAEEFPDFRNLKDLPHEGAPRTCTQVFDAFLAHCGSRVAKNDMANVTLACYRRILNGVWRTKIGAIRFLDVRYSALVKIADEADWSKKSYNNALSVLRRAFKFGYRDHPEEYDSTLNLKSARIRKQDRPVVDPFTIQDAEALIAAIHRDWAEAQGNYDEFRFFSGLRPSEEIALLVKDFDAVRRTVTVTKARVAGLDEDRRGTASRALPACPTRVETPTRAPRATPTRGQDSARPSVLQRERRADPQPAVPVCPLAPNAAAAADNPLPQTLLCPALIGELEPHDRQMPALGREATRPHHHHDAQSVCGVDRRRDPIRHPGNQARDDIGGTHTGAHRQRRWGPARVITRGCRIGRTAGRSQHGAARRHRTVALICHWIGHSPPVGAC
jgi:integrase